LPPQFSKNNKKNDNDATKEKITRTSISASNVFIDQNGFSANIGANGILHLGEGDMNGWGFSVDRLDAVIEMNTLTKASFKGNLKIPMLDSVLIYNALIDSHGSYSFSITTTKKQSFNLWAADMNLDPNSTITIDVKNDKFIPYAKLNGSLNINADLSGSKKSTDKESNLSLAQIKFENLELQTVSPYIKGGKFSLGSEKAQHAMANFPVQIDSIFINFNDNNATLGAKIMVGILGQSEGNIAAGGIICINGEHIKDQNNDKWRYKSIDIGLMSINASLSAFSFKGDLIFFKDDKVYGKGFQGNIDASIKIGVTDNIHILSNAIFGKVNKYKYWYFDALATISTGLQIFPGVAIYGLGGGAYYHVKQIGQRVGAMGTLGVTNTGLAYQPSDSIFLGLKAMVKLGTVPSKEVFNGDVALEMAFNNRMGVKYITFSGAGYFITPPLTINAEDIKTQAKTIVKGDNPTAEETASPRSSMRANVIINYDFDNAILYGNLKVYVNIGGIIKGSNPNNLAGEAELYFDNKDWYIYIGKPNSPVGLTMLNINKVSSYFMMGTKILESPPPPKEITDILRSPKYATYMDDLNNISNCSGIAFGSKFQTKTGDLTYLLFYGSLDAGVGFDVALKNYGNATCAGSNSPIGINGWYANGQAYAYLQCKIGIQIKIFKIKKKVSIFEGGMASILQAQMPNPIYMQGAIGGYFNVLGGLASGHFDFKFSLGEKCDIQGGSPLNNINVIAKVTPEDKANSVNVFSSPQAVFNYAVGTPFELTDLDNKKQSYRIRLDEFNIYDGSTILSVNNKWSEDNKTLALAPNDILPGEKTLKLKVQVKFEEYKGNTWQVVIEDGKPLVETLETTFKTDKAPDYIPQNNVAYSYPIINQLNYYKDETSEGYIKLLQGQDYLFENNIEFENKGRFSVLATGETFTFNIAYDFSNNIITFTRPANLPNEKILQFDIVRRPKTTSKNIDTNVKTVTTKVENTQSSEININTRTAEGTIKNSQDKTLFTMNFRTSKYNTAGEKFNLINEKSCWFTPIRSNVASLIAEFNTTEGFDKFEIYGTENIPKLIQFEADLSNNNWYIDNLYLIYKDYPINNLLTLNNPYGVPPLKAIYLYQDVDNLNLDQKSINNKNYDFSVGRRKGLYYDLANSMDNDYNNLLFLIVKYFWNNLNDKMRNAILAKTVYYYPSPYKVKVYYILPGKTQPNSKYEIQINNTVKL
jgi:hypothetical protein